MADGSLSPGFTVREAPATDSAKGPGDGARQAQRDRVLEAVLNAGATFWQDSDGAAYATIPADDAKGPQRYPVRSRRFGIVVRDLYGRANQRSVGSRGLVIPGSVSDSALAETLPALEALAARGRVRDPDVRACRSEGAVWLDLGGADWRLVRVAPDGWRIATGADIPLVRPDGLRPLPTPLSGANRADTLRSLRALLNIDPARPGDFMLAVAWLVAALHPAGPFPVLALDGEQGSGKSTTCKMLRRLVDPNKADLRAPPRKEDDLIVAAQSARVVALDNVSFIEADTADALCRLATGAGLSKRRLYTDGDEHLVNVCRPVLLNGIPSLLARGDLADRALAITLPAIPDHRRRPEDDVWRDFDAAAPAILGVLLDALVAALAGAERLRLPRLPRMADFARLACAAAPALGWTAENMLAAIEANRADAVATVIEADPVAVAVRALVDAQPGRTWQGTGTELLGRLNEHVSLDHQRERGYPKDAARLSTRLRRLAPALRRAGYDIALPTSGGRDGRTITLRAVQPANSVPGVPTVPGGAHMADSEGGYL